MKTQLWIDLEGTVIPHWSYIGEFINMDKLDAIIKEYSPESMGIYSYAVWTDENYIALRKSALMAHLSAKMGYTYVHVRNTVEMAKDWFSQHRHQSDVNPSNDLIWKQPKEFAFLMTVNALLAERPDGSLVTNNAAECKRFILFDDTAPHGKTYTINGDVEVIFLNPDNM